MSDDEEMPPMDGEMPPMDGGDVESEFEDDGPGGDDGLPEGIKKEVLNDASGEWRTPKKGDEVSVHYVGTLESDGTKFDSSRDRGQPFVFTLGKGQVIKGWDLGVASMKKGEVAKFTLSPEFAYGDAGSPPKIPEKATLIFEIELISWVSKDDLFGDDGVIKTQVSEGSGWKRPKSTDEVLLSFKTMGTDGNVIEEKADIEYTLGSEALGTLGKACDKALEKMKRGETISLKCTKDYLYGDERAPEGGTIELTLHEIFEVKDVSLQKDKSVMKKQVREGDDTESVKDGAKVTLKVVSATDGKEDLPGFEAKALEFTAGNGEVCDLIECSCFEMKKGERAIVTCTNPAICAEPQLGLKEAPKAEKVVLTLEMMEFEKKDTWSMSEDEKVEFGLARKEVGSMLFKAGRFAAALERYKKVIDLFGYTENFKEENKTKAQDMKQTCQLNKAACHLKLGQSDLAKKACDEVLKLERVNVKATFRRAQALLQLGEFADCMRDTKRVLELDPQNRDARLLLKKARAGQKEEDDKAKNLFAKMCQGLSSPATAKKSAADTPAAMEENGDEAVEEKAAADTPAAMEENGDEAVEKKAAVAEACDGDVPKEEAAAVA